MEGASAGSAGKTVDERSCARAASNKLTRFTCIIMDASFSVLPAQSTKETVAAASIRLTLAVTSTRSMLDADGGCARGGVLDAVDEYTQKYGSFAADAWKQGLWDAVSAAVREDSSAKDP